MDLWSAASRDPKMPLRLAAAVAILAGGVLLLTREPRSLYNPLALGHAADLTPGALIQLTFGFAVLALMLWPLRVIASEFAAYYGTGALELRPLLDATGASEKEVLAAGLQLRSLLALPQMYPVTTVPGDSEPQRLVEVLGYVSSVRDKGGVRNLLRAAYGYVFPYRTFVVEAALLKRDELPVHGVAIQVRRLPGADTELETVWSSSRERALKRAAYQIGAHILPFTKSCRSPLWRDWQGRRLPSGMFRSYHRAKKMILERRYDEALHLFSEMLRSDPANKLLRYEKGQLLERLWLNADALVQYMTLVDEIFPLKDRHPEGGPVRRAFPKWWPSGPAIPFAIRYRYIVMLSGHARKFCWG
jgi:hypothetical protein